VIPSLVVAALLTLSFALVIAIRSKQLHLWLWPHIRRSLGGRPNTGEGPIHVFLCVADHFEPAVGGALIERQRERVREWTTRYPDFADGHRDWEGRPHQHTFFFPAEEYVEEHLDALALLCERGGGMWRSTCTTITIPPRI
jgi:hypothetical protein